MIFALEGQFEDGIHTVHDEPEMTLGEHWHSPDLVSDFSYLRYAEDVKIGDTIRTKYNLYSKTNLSPQTDGGSTYAPAGSMQITEHDATYLTSLAGIPKEPTYRDYGIIVITGGAGAGQQGIITTYTNKKLNITWMEDGMFTDGTLKTALDNTSDYVIYAPWYVEKVSDVASTAVDTIAEVMALRNVVNGVSVVNADKDEYGLARWCGNGPVRVTGTVAAGQTLFPGITPGTTLGTAATDQTSPLLSPYATVEHAHTFQTGADAKNLVQANIYAKRIGIVPEPPQHINRAFKRPYQIDD